MNQEPKDPDRPRTPWIVWVIYVVFFGGIWWFTGWQGIVGWFLGLFYVMALPALFIWWELSETQS